MWNVNFEEEKSVAEEYHSFDNGGFDKIERNLWNVVGNKKAPLGNLTHLIT